jgi:replicative DNA helicase Mcm
MDTETGKFDIDRIATGITSSQRGAISVMKDIINELEKNIGKVISIEDVVREAAARDVSEDKAMEVIDKLKRAGDLFSPKHGFISKI